MSNRQTGDTARFAVASLLAGVLLLSGCQHRNTPAAPPAEASQKSPGPASQPASALYFGSPQEAVERVTELLRREDWPTLARYYALSGTNIARARLTSGEYFLRKERPPSHHPGLPWKYKHPFTPGFKFERAEDAAAKDVVRVTVGLSIDQGAGPPQRGFETFFLRRADQGFQVLPDEAEPPESAGVLEGYTPKAGADTVSDLRPSLAARVSALPQPSLTELPKLLEKLQSLQSGAEPVLPPPSRGRPAAIYGREVYDPSDEELLVSELGERIEQVLESSEPAKVVETLRGRWAGPMQLEYHRIKVGHEDAIGAGRQFYAGKPELRKVNLPKKGTGF